MTRFSVLFLCTAPAAWAFAPPIHVPRTVGSVLRSSLNDNADLQQKIKDKKMEGFNTEPKMNPDRPELPELKGDFDWDEKFAGDQDWITEDVPGRIVLNEIDLAKQVTALNQLENQWRKERAFEEYEASKKVGWVPEAELANGRTAMFFLVTGLLTELWTGLSLPQQVEEMLRVSGLIGFD